MEYTGMLKIPSPGIPGSALVSLPGAERRRKAIEADLKEFIESLPRWMSDPAQHPVSAALPYMPHLRRPPAAASGIPIFGGADGTSAAAPFLSPDPEPMMYLRSGSADGSSVADEGKRVDQCRKEKRKELCEVCGELVKRGPGDGMFESCVMGSCFHACVSLHAVVLLNRPKMMAYLQGQTAAVAAAVEESKEEAEGRRQEVLTRWLAQTCSESRGCPKSL
ncbi:hypothetical protein BC829DRAFT_77528 [Chytridium lagenaria]|nr:hypothetical protein BC829DRAFT_77528 [Chytridium lagenaria]